MGIKHQDVKSSGDKGYASEWNKDHVIDGDVNFNSHKITNLATPTADTDGATKKYVDDKVRFMARGGGFNLAYNEEQEFSFDYMPYYPIKYFVIPFNCIVKKIWVTCEDNTINEEAIFVLAIINDTSHTRDWDSGQIYNEGKPKVWELTPAHTLLLGDKIYLDFKVDTGGTSGSLTNVQVVMILEKS